jgi:carbon storage regulator
MLVVTRKKDEKLIIGDDIEVQVLRIGRENVRLGIKAPSDVSIYRYEIFEAIRRREQEAGESGSGSSAVASGEAPPPVPSAKARGQSEG